MENLTGIEPQFIIMIAPLMLIINRDGGKAQTELSAQYENNIHWRENVLSNFIPSYPSRKKQFNLEFSFKLFV